VGIEVFEDCQHRYGNINVTIVPIAGFEIAASPRVGKCGLKSGVTVW
jgi:hypothetical protein